MGSLCFFSYFQTNTFHCLLLHSEDLEHEICLTSSRCIQPHSWHHSEKVWACCFVFICGPNIVTFCLFITALKCSALFTHSVPVHQFIHCLAELLQACNDLGRQFELLECLVDIFLRLLWSAVLHRACLRKWSVAENITLSLLPLSSPPPSSWFLSWPSPSRVSLLLCWTLASRWGSHCPSWEARSTQEVSSNVSECELSPQKMSSALLLCSQILLPDLGISFKYHLPVLLCCSFFVHLCMLKMWFFVLLPIVRAY